MKKMRWLAMLLALVMVAAACASDDADGEEATDEGTEESAEGEEEAMEDDEESAEGEEEAMEDDEVELTQGGDLTFHMITHSDDGPFWSVVNRGMEAACEDVGVNCVWVPGNNDANVMVTGIETAIGEGSDGIAASLPSPDQLIGPLQDAVAAGVPVITLNSGANDYQEIGALTHVGQTEFIAGQGAAQRFNDAGATTVLCAFQEQSNVGLEERCGGLEADFNGTVITEFAGLDADQTAQINGISAILSANEDIDAILGTGPVVTISALTAAQDLGRDVTIGGFDITPEVIDAIDAGDIAFTVDQQQFLQGYLPIVLLYLNVTNLNTAGGGLPILTGPGFVTTDNAAQVAALVSEGTR